VENSSLPCLSEIYIVQLSYSCAQIPYTIVLSDYLIFFAFNLIVSSLTKMPFPLYGSGFRHARISAANCITTSFSTPSSRIRVGCGVLAVTPSGTPSSMGCEYPTFSETNFCPE